MQSVKYTKQRHGVYPSFMLSSMFFIVVLLRLFYFALCSTRFDVCFLYALTKTRLNAEYILNTGLYNLHATVAYIINVCVVCSFRRLWEHIHTLAPSFVFSVSLSLLCKNRSKDNDKMGSSHVWNSSHFNG